MSAHTHTHADARTHARTHTCSQSRGRGAGGPAAESPARGWAAPGDVQARCAGGPGGRQQKQTRGVSPSSSAGLHVGRGESARGGLCSFLQGGRGFCT